MTRRHLSYLAGFLFIWLVWAASFGVAVGAVAVGSSATWRGRWKATSTSAS
jgi:hypothetical protein